MTSWIRVAPKKKQEEVRSLFFKLEEGEFCSQFNQYFYSKLYADSLGRPLITYDRSNPISANFPLIQGTFQTTGTFSDAMVPNVTMIAQRDMAKIFPYINELSKDELRLKAVEFLQWNSETLASVKALKTQNHVPETCDVGVHIRAPESRDRLPVSAYIAAITEVYNRLKKNTINVFVASENQLVLQDFLSKVPSTWKIHMIQSSNPNVSGFSQLSFDRQPQRIRLVTYNEFLANLACLQTCENLITTLSSDVGRFLYLTNEVMTHFRSMDMPVFTPF
jgi:hypothetical protein